jgi:hypothetical protein
MTRPWLNSVIAAVTLLGFALSVRDLAGLVIEARRLDSISGALEQDVFKKAPGKLINEVGVGIVSDRCRRILDLTRRSSTSVPDAVGMLADADAESEDGRGVFVRYLIGLLVFLGLIGTFWGLLITVSGIKQVLQALEPARVDDPAAFISQLKSSIGGLLGGMSTAFSTSLFGLGGSVILGFVEVRTRQARLRFLSDLDRFSVSGWLPAVLPRTRVPLPGDTGVPAAGTEADHVYQMAVQETYGDNIRRLTEMFSRQASIDEKVSGSLVEMKGAIEALRDEEIQTRNALQSANQDRRSVLERLDSLGRHLERLINEVRLARESSDDAGRAIQDRLKLEGELTNKTLSLGFSDLTRRIDSVGQPPPSPTNPAQGQKKEGE